MLANELKKAKPSRFQMIHSFLYYDFKETSRSREFSDDDDDAPFTLSLDVHQFGEVKRICLIV